MDIGFTTSTTSRLLDALERTGLSPGEGLVSSGPSPVPADLARMFESLMEQGQPAMPTEAADLSRQTVPRTDKTASAGVGGEPLRTEGTEPVRGNESAPIRGGEETLPSPSELYRLQFQVGMLRFQAEIGSNVKQQTTQGLDSLLRNQS